LHALLSYAAAAIGSALGGTLRYACGLAAAAWLGDAVWLGTIGINAAGSFVIGWFAGLSAPDGRHPGLAGWRVFVMVGVCGGYTTFSSFSLQTVELLRAGDGSGAAVNVGLSLVLCLVAVWLGDWAACPPRRIP
jgi:CrcB protein